MIKQIEINCTSIAFDRINNASPYLSNDDVRDVWNSSKQNALEEFDSRKMGDDDTSLEYRTQLTKTMDELKPRLESRNQNKKSNHHFDRRVEKTATTLGTGAVGAGIGGVIAGPPGAIVGAFFGAIFGMFTN